MKEYGRLRIHLKNSKKQGPRLTRSEREKLIIELKSLEEDIKNRVESYEEIIKYTNLLKKRRK